MPPAPRRRPRSASRASGTPPPAAAGDAPQTSSSASRARPSSRSSVAAGHRCRPISPGRCDRPASKGEQMRVLVAGASGAIGTRLVPQLLESGHEVVGTYRSPGHGDRIRALGGQAVELDLLDRAAVRNAVLGSEPEAIVHQATALAGV